MADETLSWEMKLFDHMSGALGSAERHLDSLLKSLGITSKGMDKFSSSAKSAAAASRGVGASSGVLSGGRFDVLKRFGDRLFGGRHDANFIGPRELPGRRFTRSRQRLASNLFGDGAEERTNRRYRAVAKKVFGDDSDKNVDRIKGGFEKIGAAGAFAAKALAGAAAAIGAAAAGVAAAGAKWAVEGLVFQENSMATFETMLGSEEAAARVFKQAAAFASSTPFSSEEVVSGFQRFLTAGFKEEQLDTLMRAAGDVGASMGTEKMQSVMIAMGQIKAKGKLQSEELMQLADAGIGQLSVKEALQRTTGKSRAQVDKMITGGKITGDQGIEAILEAIRVSLSGGELGGNMQRQSRTLSGLFSSMMDIPTTLLYSSNILKATGPFKDLIAGINKSFEEGQPLFDKGVAMFKRVANVWNDAFGRINASDVSVALEKAISLLGDLMSNAGVLLGSFFERLMESIGSAFGDDHDAAAHMKDLGKSIADLVVTAIWAADGLVRVLGIIQHVALQLWSWTPVGAAANMIRGDDSDRERRRLENQRGSNDVADIWGRLSAVAAKEKQRKIDETKEREKGFDLQAWLGMPKIDSSKIATDDGKSKAPTVTTTIGDIHVNVQPGQEGGVVDAIAANIRKNLPTQIGNFALEHGG